MSRDLAVAAPLDRAGDRGGYPEKRRHPRRQLAVRCWIGDGRHTLYARVHDVSLGGLSIRAPVSFRPDARLELALVPIGDDGAQAAIRARGRVVWVRAPSGASAPRMGAEFLELIDGEALLRRLMEAP